MTAPSPFLTARWSNLLLVTFAVPEALVRERVHPALELDRWRGATHVSLVAFDFLDTRVLGVKVPGHVRFPEVNLRTYVRHGDVRGVAFIREFVPRPAIATVARILYNEPYRSTSMSSRTVAGDGEVRVEHRWRWAGREHRLGATGSAAAHTPPPDGAEHHFKEHAWGFGATRGGRLLRYRVDHPEWAVREIRSLEYDVDFAALYGPDWSAVQCSEPVSLIFAVGSEVAVHRPTGEC